jgi:hypothetical protein
MAKGRKTGGRRVGSMNRRSLLEEVLYEIDPSDGRVYWQQLHALAAGEHKDAHVRVKALSLLLSYKYGKPTEHVELSGPEGGPIPVHDHFVVADENLKKNAKP